MSVRFVVRLKVHGEQLVLMFQIIVRVFLQMCMGYLEKKCGWMIGVLGSCWCYWIFLGDCWWGLVWWWWLISNFEKMFEFSFFYKENLCLL